MLTAMRTGLRIGELRALRWQDVDLVAGKLLVRKAAAKQIVGSPICSEYEKGTVLDSCIVSRRSR